MDEAQRFIHSGAGCPGRILGGMRELETAIGFICEASVVAAQAFETQVLGEAKRKPDGSPVTETDLAVEDLLRANLSAAFPDDAVLGEERATTAGTSGRRWVIDPIGGTADFVRRIPLFSIDLAMEDEGGPAVAVSAMPMSRLVMAAARGRGCWVLDSRDPRPLPERRTRVSGRTDLTGAVVCGHNIKAWSPGLLSAVHGRCVLRDAVYSVLRLVSGEVDAVVLAGGGMGYDDLACLPVLVGEAGGRVTDLSGRPVLDGDGTVLATNGVLHDRFLDLVSGLT